MFILLVILIMVFAVFVILSSIEILKFAEDKNYNSGFKVGIVLTYVLVAMFLLGKIINLIGV